jgi:hypothetical protein
MNPHGRQNNNKVRIMTCKHMPPSLLTIAVVAAMSSAQTQAYTFDAFEGELTGKLDTTLSAGASISTQAPNHNLYTHANGLLSGRSGGQGASPNADNGRLNFDKGDVISNPYKGLSELELEYGQVGMRVSAKYWYDHQLETRNGRFNDFDDSGFPNQARFKGFSWLDSYVFGSTEVAGHALDARFGSQVLSWGESTFIQGGINSINPIDQSAFNRPGVDIKEGLLPVEMLQASVGLAQGLSIEGFYQLNWRPTVIDGCGTFFALTDALQPGCGPIVSSPLIGEAEQLNGTGNPVPVGANMAVQRTADNLPSDAGQFGLALRYYADWLNDTEFGLYAMNYHSRLVYVSGTSADYSKLAIGTPTDQANFFSGRYVAGLPVFIHGANYNAVYPEDIRLYGVSFNTSLESGLALSGEVSYRPNLPVQINVNDLLAATLLQASNPATGLLLPGGSSNSANFNQEVPGYTRLPVTQAQVTLTHFFNQVLGADQMKLVGELGYVHVANLDALRYGRSSALGPGTPVGGGACNSSPLVTNKYCTDNGFVTANSWGYRLVGQLDYSDLIPAVVISPSLAFRHDVDGYSYQPAGPFEEGQMATTLGLQAVYQDRYKANASWTSFFGSNDYSTVDDRDYLALSVSMSF